MNKETKFTSESILDIKFDKASKGYKALQVDQILDQIISDYKIYEEESTLSKNKIAKLTKEVSDLKDQLRKDKLEIENLKIELKTTPSNYSADNVGLLKRIDALERALYKKGVDPKKI